MRMAYNALFSNDDRNALHAGQASQRILSPNHNAVGMAGEWAFGEFSGLWPDTTDKPSGDGGKDFILPLLFTVDIKTARKAIHLIHEEGKPFADIFILAEYDDLTDRATMIGWAWGGDLKKAPVDDGSPSGKFKHGVCNHYIHRSRLRDMNKLSERIIRLTT